jgi:AraC-like DNA-binding protein
MIIYQTENIGGHFEYRTSEHTKWIKPPHIHEYSELAFTINGRSTVILNGERQIVEAGHIMLILPNQIHEYTDETESTLRCAVFSNDYIPAFFEMIGSTVPKNPILDLRPYPEIIKMINDSPSLSPLGVTAMLNLLFNLLISSTEFVSADTSKQSVFFEAILYVTNHFTEDINLATVAKSIGYHEKYLSCALHGLTNMNFRTFLSSYRVNYAKELLSSESHRREKISEIALKCGFSSINTFNRAFLSITGLTPKEYKNAHLSAKSK